MNDMIIMNARAFQMLDKSDRKSCCIAERESERDVMETADIKGDIGRRSTFVEKAGCILLDEKSEESSVVGNNVTEAFGMT